MSDVIDDGRAARPTPPPGRGLPEPVRVIPLAILDVSPCNTRKDLDAGCEDTSLDDLAESIRVQGLLSPPTVRPAGDGRYEVVAGQRRVLACRRLGWAELPVLVREGLGDSGAVALSLVENVQRAEMSAMDKAHGFATLLKAAKTPAGVARLTGIPASTVRLYLKLEQLPPSLQAKVTTNAGPAGVSAMAQLATSFRDPAAMEAAWDQVQGFTGAQARRLLQRSGGDLEALAASVDVAIEETFDRRMCGTSLETCPFLPPGAAPAVLALVRAARAGGAGATGADGIES
jgi:ParB family chromosome partitioning protein